MAPPDGKPLDEAVPWFDHQVRKNGPSRFAAAETDGWFQALLAHHGRPMDAPAKTIGWRPLPHCRD